MAERTTLTASLVGGLENESLCKLESHPKLCGRTSDDENEGDVSIESITFCSESLPLVAVPAKGLVVPLSAKHGLVKRITFRAKFCSALFPLYIDTYLAFHSNHDIVVVSIILLLEWSDFTNTN